MKNTELPAIGLSLRLMPGAVARPLSSPRVYTYTDRETGRKMDRYDPRELWRRGEHAGYWVDRAGNSLLIARVTRPLPSGFKHEHATREEYTHAAHKHSEDPQSWSADRVSAWVNDYLGVEATRAQHVDGAPSRLESLIELSYPSQPDTRRIYAFRFSRRVAGQTRAPQHWYAVIFGLAADSDIGEAETEIMDSFFEELQYIKIEKNHEVRRLVRRGQAPLTGSRDDDKSAELLASREQAAATIENLKNWWLAETENYLILSDLSSRYRVLIKDLKEEIEYLRAAYEQFIPPVTRIRAVSVIRVFSNPEEYVAYVGPQHQWSGGLWTPDKRELVIRPLGWGDSKDQQRSIRSVTYHEGFHQYLYYALNRISPSVWFNEGHAELFENARISSGKLYIEENDSHVESLQNIMKAGFDARDLLFKSYNEFYSNDEIIRRRNYTLAWAVVYYLRKYVPTQPHSPYAELLDRYLEALQETQDQEKATQKAFEQIDYQQFATDVQNFWLSRNDRGRAKRNRIFQNSRSRLRR